MVLVCLAAGCWWPAIGHAQDDYRAERVASKPSGIADSIAKALAPEGARLLTDEGKTIAEVWLRQEIPLKANAAEAGYGALGEGTLVGVLRLSEGGSDFRGQTIASGIYTLRYEHIPQDGNHLGAAPSADFLLLCPAGEDQDLDATFDFESLVELSRHATGTNHPGPLMLMRLSGAAEFPGVEQNDLGHLALRMKTSARATTWDQSQDFALALTLVGIAE